MNLDFEPFKPINTSLYLCDNKFHTEVRFVLASCLSPVFLFVFYLFFLLYWLTGSLVDALSD